MVGEEDANAEGEMVTDEIEKLVEFKEKGYVGCGGRRREIGEVGGRICGCGGGKATASLGNEEGRKGLGFYLFMQIYFLTLASRSPIGVQPARFQRRLAHC